MIVDQLPQHRDEAVHGVGRLAVGTGQPADRVVRAIHLRAAVDQVQTRRRGHRAGKLQYIIRVMRFRLRAALLAVLVAAATAAATAATVCSARSTEYEEDLTLRLDGSATLVVNASIPALVALRGFSLDTSPRARADQLAPRVRELYQSPYAEVVRVAEWTRSGRRFVGVRLRIPDIRVASESGAVLLVELRAAAAGRPDVLQAHARRARPRRRDRERGLDRRRGRRVPPAPAKPDSIPELPDARHEPSRAPPRAGTS